MKTDSYTIQGNDSDVKEIQHVIEKMAKFNDLPEKDMLKLQLLAEELIGMEKEIGSIEAGKKADLVVCNDNIDIKEVYIGGKAIM